MKNRIALVSIILLAICPTIKAQENYHMKMIFESIDGSDKQILYYPVDTKFYIKQDAELEKPIKTQKFCQFTGSYKLTVYSQETSTDQSELFALKDRRIKIIYYTKKTEETNLVQVEESIPIQEKTETGNLITPKEEYNISIYPIPAKEFLTINFAQASIENISLTIFNSLGQQVLNRSIENGTTSLRLELTDYVSGVYFLMIRTDDKLVEKKRIIIE